MLAGCDVINAGAAAPILNLHAEIDGLNNVQESNVEGVSLCVDLIAIVHPDALTHDLQIACLYIQHTVTI